MADKPKDDGGPAFPVAECQEDGWGHGMTLRDWFAGKAMASILEVTLNTVVQAGASPEEINSVLVDVAPSAYRLADAMLKARQ